jgi:hypothetical protein
MNNLEDKLIKIKTRNLSEEDKSFVWNGAMIKIAQENMSKKPLLINMFRNNMKYNMKKMIIGMLAVAIILGSSGIVAASNNSLPGDFLFGVDLAVEKVKISLASESKKSDLKLKFAEERISEIKHISEEKKIPASLITDLSSFIVSEIEVDVFANETLVKIEANDQRYGYVSTLKAKEALVIEIALKYSLEESKVSALMDFEVEDRVSGADDKKFLNKTHSVNFSEEESKDVGVALTNIENLLKDSGDDERSQKIQQALKELLVLLGDDADIEVKKDGGEIKIETANGDKIKIEFKEDNKNEKDDDKSGKSSDIKDENESDDSNDKNDDKGGENKVNSSDDSSFEQDVREDDSEVFCRGEWRDAEDCNGDSSDDIEDDDSDDSDEDEEEDDSEDDNDNDEDESDDDNSGHGGGNNNDEDDN